MPADPIQDAESVARLVISPGQAKYLRMVSLHGDLEGGRSWFASVGHGFRQYRAHRAAVKELGDWLPWHDRPENARTDGEDDHA